MSRGRALHALCVDNSRAVIGIVVVDSVNNEIIVFGPVAVGSNGLKAAAGNALDPGLQDGKVLEVAALQRKFVDRDIREGATQRVRNGFDQRLLPGPVSTSVAAPGVSWKSRPRLVATSRRIPRRLNFLKPGASTVTWYRPGARLRATYSPASFVCSTRATPVSVLRTVTCALVATAPVDSVATPEMLP